MHDAGHRCKEKDHSLINNIIMSTSPHKLHTQPPGHEDQGTEDLFGEAWAVAALTCLDRSSGCLYNGWSDNYNWSFGFGSFDQCCQIGLDFLPNLAPLQPGDCLPCMHQPGLTEICDTVTSFNYSFVIWDTKCPLFSCHQERFSNSCIWIGSLFRATSLNLSP